jgi:ornithine--oxo-acid transaminase
MNVVDICLCILAKQRVRRSVHHDVSELIAAIEHYIDGHSDRANHHFDALSAYSALNFGHRHPRLVATAVEQLERLTLTSRAFNNDQLGPFCDELARFCGKGLVLPMNAGAEGVESAIKVARKWGYERKGVPRDQAKIVVCERNFHGRTTTIVSFSSDPLARTVFGPYTHGFGRSHLRSRTPCVSRSMRTRSRSSWSRCRARPA